VYQWICRSGRGVFSFVFCPARPVFDFLSFNDAYDFICYGIYFSGRTSDHGICSVYVYCIAHSLQPLPFAEYHRKWGAYNFIGFFGVWGAINSNNLENS